MKFSIVILHYNLISETIKCVNSLKKILPEKHEVKIIIVDNGSNNDTGNKLKDAFKKDSTVDVICTNRNLGFAKGNNIGYVYALENYNPDFIVLSNNDILIEQMDFFDAITKVEENASFSVCGPDILNPNKMIHQNPHYLEGYTIDSINRLIVHNSIKLLVLKFLRLCKAYELLLRIKKRLIKNVYCTNNYDKEQVNVVLSGAFLIFSKRFMAEFPKGLFSETFMYMEEDILYYMCMKRKLNIVYTPQLKVIHNEGMATKAETSSAINKNIFETKYTLDSAKIFKRLMKLDLR
ncbi:MAG: glycosyltransferase, group 2 family protein [Clostridiaceae bacterium]|jgi:GT2 family glycosyltransferase|nr:glycosyltransferase, group 2 family protein [Clostridiaceae bacterium]